MTSVFRRRRLEVFYKEDVLKNLAKFIGKHLRWSLFLRKLYLLKERLRHTCFPLNFAKFLRTSFFIENIPWLLLCFARCKLFFQEGINRQFIGYLLSVYLFCDVFIVVLWQRFWLKLIMVAF